MKPEEFRAHAHQLVDWMADYMKEVEQYPVKSQVNPGAIYQQLPASAPEEAEEMSDIFRDFKQLILPGVTHWQSPNYYAYFPANASPPSILAEMLTATLAAQCMKWETSPAAAELEERVIHWLRDAMGLPKTWTGVIHDTASTATLTAILSARERSANYRINEKGYSGDERYRIYCSSQTHSSIEKGAKIAGIGRQNVVKVEVDETLAIRPEALETAIQEDLAADYQPLCVVSATGTTGTTAMDPLAPIADICTRYNIWLHVDAAYAGTAMLLPEYQHYLEGIELADSYVFNPHKWMFTNFDCTAYFIKDPQALLRTFAILPEYLKTKTDGQVNNYCDWGIPLGRRFRALKLWFVLRAYGLQGIREKLRKHIRIATWLETEVTAHPDFSVVAPRSLNLVCFRYAPRRIQEKDALNALNQRLLHRLNDSGKIYLTHTKAHGWYTLRMVIGQTNVEQHHVEAAWQLIQKMALELKAAKMG